MSSFPKASNTKRRRTEVNKKAEDLLREALSRNPPDFSSLMPQDGKTVTTTGRFLALYAFKDRQAELKGLIPAHYTCRSARGSRSIRRLCRLPAGTGRGAREGLERDDPSRFRIFASAR